MMGFRKKKTFRLNASDQAAFLSELAELSQAGYSLGLSLDVLKTGHPHWSPGLLAVQEKLAVGMDLSAALKELLSPTLATYLDLARQHGRFDETLHLLAEKVRQLLSYQRQLKQALAYPVLLIFILIGLVFTLEQTLYPVFAELAGNVGSSGGNNWPLAFLHGLLGMVIMLAVALFIFYAYLLRCTPLKRLLILTKVPILSGMTKDLVSALLAENLAVFLGAGLSLPSIIEHFFNGGDEDHSLSAELAKYARRALLLGISVDEWLEKQSYVRPGLSAYLTRGFDSRTLAAYLSYYAKREYERFDQQVKSFFAMLQPVLFSIIGGTIVLLYLAMLLPLYQNLGGYQL
ncbi:type II secretion system F family protein [Fructobacillus durionis]|uniref:Competence protein ComGB n=1 Tax=Fructobacillus durionis TaxID=283737 RepID=A0A1I1DZ85_9LACO|nr:type II secretion system F family protein [Fructobacillus durionis]SFB77903.1 competence protein ComGB [Fructobacillus durionis]